ncbi:MAG: 23S rRNA (guanosine(2251)-2'-O)-methyltransferase RlmB [Thermoanaerobaculia bacterium]
MLIAGFHPVREALEGRPKAVEAVLLLKGKRDQRASEIEGLAREAGVAIRFVTREELDRSAGRAHNGVAARVAERAYDSVEECFAFGEAGNRRILFLDEITDPGNLGSILRTAAAAGASVVIPERNSVGLTEAVVKTSAGALERVKVARIVNASQFMESAKKQGFWVYGAALGGETYTEVDLSGDVVLCLGAEGKGLRRLTAETCDRLVTIPMKEGAGSLNVAVAAGILLFEAMRKNFKKSESGTEIA